MMYASAGEALLVQGAHGSGGAFLVSSSKRRWIDHLHRDAERKAVQPYNFVVGHYRMYPYDGVYNHGYLGSCCETSGDCLCNACWTVADGVDGDVHDQVDSDKSIIIPNDSFGWHRKMLSCIFTKSN